MNSRVLTLLSSMVILVGVLGIVHAVVTYLKAY